MDFDFILAQAPAFLTAAWLTIKLSFFGIIFSLIIGLFCILMSYFKIKILE
ncbi:amino acid ABC transporter permease, partial [Campylobacter jejuni]|nr:amino acid ABC transporter permease [Campylobacter jejuni]EDH3248173.1 amino acid ABC transporter permease [Campylobacter jejuni]